MSKHRASRRTRAHGGQLQELRAARSHAYQQFWQTSDDADERLAELSTKIATLEHEIAALERIHAGFKSATPAVPAVMTQTASTLPPRKTAMLLRDLLA